MNKSKKVTLTLLGIAASVGLGSLITTSWRQVPLVEAARELSDADSPISGVASISCPPIRVDSVTSASISISPTPAPEKPLREGCARFTCEKCGQEYDACSGETSNEEIKQVKKHEHLSPKTERN